MKIFEPIKINKLEIKNRLVVSAMVTNYIGNNGEATEKFIAYHERKAQGGFGLILPEDYVVSPEAGGFSGLPGLWKDEQIASHKRLTERVHDAGARIFAQIYHAGRETTSAVNGVRCSAPSAIPDPVMGEIPHELTKSEIHEIEIMFGECALRAKKAGFDGVEIHGAHGYLIGQFNSPFSNKRTDEYGGSIENRCRFMVEVIEEVRKQVGDDYPIQLRISADEFVDGGLTIEDSKIIAMIAEQAGIDSIHVSQGIYASSRFITPPSCVPHAVFTDNAAAIKSVVSIPVIAVGRINDPMIAESVIRSGKADMCSMARASLADPYLPLKAKEGRFCEINRCIGCLQGCTGEESKGQPVRCLVNPLTGMEDEYELAVAKKPKKVIVVGGGVAGCEAAIVAAKRGHDVTIFEKSGELGGQWIAAAIPVGKGDFTSFLRWQKVMLEKLGVKIKYNMAADRETVDSYCPDAVILAYGSDVSVPPIPGLREFGVFAEDVLRGRKEFGKRTVVIGGGLVGAETADHIAFHGASEVSIIEMLPRIAGDGEEASVYFLKDRLAKKNVRIYTSAKVSAVTEHAVSFMKEDKQEIITDVDTIIIATGRRANPALSESFNSSSYEVVTVGDALRAKNGYRDIREGFEAGLHI
jgi:2,4-dienoyl-CoA reductase-like NADH-dependent reductase (Old Yellow Enzyme family)/thioredoxin reductase